MTRKLGIGLLSAAITFVVVVSVWNRASPATTQLPPGEVCFQATTGLNGMVGLLGTVTGGSGYTAGTYGGVPLTGGSGTGATGSIVVSAGAVTSVVIQNPGVNYVVGDILSAAAVNVGGTGSGFAVPVSSISVNSSLAGGSVNMFVPNTTIPKATWKDPNQVTANTQPIVLDANGCAIIYGTGSYRQQVFDSLGNLIFDQLTTDTSSQQAPFWAGIAGGTPNAITLVDPGFNATDGSVINFTALATNTGATTINPSSFGNITVLKDTTGGPVGLTGGEIIQTNPISAIYRSIDNAFHLLNTAIASASGATAPLCGAIGLKVTNGGTPNSIISLTADQIVMQTAAGLTINRSNVSLTGINITTGASTATANGMDGESAGTNNWLYIWAIDNGAAPAGLVSSSSGNGLSPTIPSGYTYKCRMGAMRVDGSGNLLRTLQFGSESQYQVTAASNTSVLPIITSSVGSYWTAQSVTSFVPPTAAKISIATELNVQPSSSGAGNQTDLAHAGVAPNPNYGTPLASGRPPCFSYQQFFFSNTTWVNVLGSGLTCTLVLESTNIYTGAATSGSGTGLSASGVISALGWKDKVNAN
jgi:hypothetical protein